MSHWNHEPHAHRSVTSAGTWLVSITVTPGGYGEPESTSLP